MKSAVIVFPGSNRERDMLNALEMISGTRPAAVWHADSELPDVDLVVVPGGGGTSQVDEHRLDSGWGRRFGRTQFLRAAGFE